MVLFYVLTRQVQNSVKSEFIGNTSSGVPEETEAGADECTGAILTGTFTAVARALLPAGKPGVERAGLAEEPVRTEPAAPIRLFSRFASSFNEPDCAVSCWPAEAVSSA